MALALVRIDDRLIHGQVSVGWVQALQPDRILLANDAVAADPGLRDLYTMAAPPEVPASICTIHETADKLQEDDTAAERTLLLVESPHDALELRLRGVNIRSVNVGGLHYTEGRRCLLPYLFVSEEDLTVFKNMLALGMEVECRDVPSARKIDMRNLL